MKRNYGVPGRIDLAEIHAPPAGGRWAALAVTGVVLVALIGAGLLLAAFAAGAHSAWAHYATGGR